MKVYLIIGAGSDIGIAYIQRLIKSENDIHIIALYRNMSEKLRAVIESQKDRFLPLQVDLSDSEQIKKAIDEINKEGLIPTHILHLAAKPYEFAKIKNWDESDVKESMQISVYSLAKICSEYLPKMAKAKSGKVVAIVSSVTFDEPPKFTSMYTTVKYALLGFIKSAAVEYADKGITVSALSPGMVDTKFLSNIDEHIKEMAIEDSPNKRLITVDEVAEKIEYLFLDESDNKNGINMKM